MTTANTDFWAPFEQFWTDAKTEAQVLITDAETLGTQLETAAVADFEAVLKTGWPIAVQAVLAAAPLVMGGSEKFGTAVASVVQTLETTLGRVLVQDVQALVQMAFRALQATA